MNCQHFLFQCLQHCLKLLRRRHEEFRHQTRLQQEEEILQEILISHPDSTKENVTSISSNSMTAKRDTDLKLHFFSPKILRLRSVQLTRLQLQKENSGNSSSTMFPPSWKSNVENEGRFDFGKTIFEERKCRFHFDALQKSKQQDIDVHREEVSYIVSEEFFEQFTTLAFIDFKKTSPNNCPACRVCHEEADPLQKL